MDEHLEGVFVKFDLQLKEIEEDYIRTKKFDDPDYQSHPVLPPTETPALVVDDDQADQIDQPYQQLNSSGDDYNSTSHNTNEANENGEEPESNTDNENAGDDHNSISDEFANDQNQFFTISNGEQFGHKGTIDTTELQNVLKKHQEKKKEYDMTEEKAATIKEIMKDVPRPKVPAWADKFSDEDLLSLAKSILAPK
jgi:hypothetical protein